MFIISYRRQITNRTSGWPTNNYVSDGNLILWGLLLTVYDTVYCVIIFIGCIYMNTRGDQKVRGLEM